MDDEIKCIQCELLIDDGEEMVLIAGLCPDCQHVHALGWVHLVSCHRDLLQGEVDPRMSQMRRPGLMGWN